MRERAEFTTEDREIESVERQCYTTDYTIFSTTRGISLPRLKFLEKEDDDEDNSG